MINDIPSKEDIVRKELDKCDISVKDSIEIASSKNIRLNDECFIHPIYGDMIAFISKDGILSMMEISSNGENQNVYCDVSVNDIIASPWGTFNESAINGKNVSSKARSIFNEIKAKIVVKKGLNDSQRRSTDF